MKVSEVMTLDTVTVGPTAPLSEARRLMEDYRLRHLPVERDGLLVGVLSDRDLVEGADRLVSHVDEEITLAPPTVSDVLKPIPVTVGPDETLDRSAELLAEWGVGSLPVVTEGRLLGLVTETDVLEAFVAACRYGGEAPADDPTVSARMTRDPVALEPTATLAQAAERMRAGDFRHLPIVDGGRLMGVLSDRDLRRAVGRDVDEEAWIGDLVDAKPVTVEGGERLSRAAEHLVEHRISALPVVERGRLVGVLTTTDVLEHCAQALGSAQNARRSANRPEGQP